VTWLSKILASAGGGHTIKNGGITLPARKGLNLDPADFLLADSSGSDETAVALAAKERLRATTTAVGIAVSATKGLEAENTSLATNGNQQWSLPVKWRGSGWGTSGPGAQAVEWASVCEPQQDFNSLPVLGFWAQVASGGWTPKFRILTDGFALRQAGNVSLSVAGWGAFRVEAASGSQPQRPIFTSDQGTQYVFAVPDLVDANRQTTNATLTTALTIAIPDNCVVSLGVRVKARQTGGSANFHFKNYTVDISRVNAGAATIVTGSLVTGTNLLPASWGGGTVEVSGNNALLRITGLAATTINWTTQVWMKQEFLP